MKMIEVERLCKKYWINHQRLSSDSLKEALSSSFKNWAGKIFGKTDPQQGFFSKKEEFWALKEVNFEILEGDRVALLGRNGAGKSTLLKILSRITEPTSGSVKLSGRVSSLLEVGTGFHPDLTGRENILLNGAIMGMSFREVRRKFDEIVAFADIEKFLDTPLKRYSSGMYMRLGFAIAAHLDSEIMIVDEVLAVGDAQFQEKCLNKMNEIGAQNRTVLFVSHNINSVLSLCNKGILLENGELKAFEPIEQAVSRYVRSCPLSGLSWKGEAGDDSIRIMEASLRPPSSNASFYNPCDKTALDIEFEILKPHADLVLGFTVFNSRKAPICWSRLCDHADFIPLVNSTGRHKISFEMDLSLFHPGEYHIQMDCSLLNQKKILQGEVMLKFALFDQSKSQKLESGVEKEGISLGNRWTSF